MRAWFILLIIIALNIHPAWGDSVSKEAPLSSPNIVTDNCKNSKSPISKHLSGIPQLPTAILAFSDHPERVTQLGQLFSGGLLALKPTQFQFYHQGGRGDNDLFLAAFLTNNGKQPAKVHIIEGSGGPYEEYFDAGHYNNRNFLRNLADCNGTLYQINPGETIKTFFSPLPNEQVISCTQRMLLMEGSDVRYDLFAVSDANEVPGFSLLSNPKDVHARGFYPVSEVCIQRTIDINHPEDFITIGSLRQPSLDGGPELKGDYGVVYKIKITLKNKSNYEKNAEIIFNPRGGKATGTFLISENEDFQDSSKRSEIYIDKPCEAFERVPVTKVTLPSKTSKTLYIWTIPEGASNYPVRLVLTNAQIKEKP